MTTSDLERGTDKRIGRLYIENTCVHKSEMKGSHLIGDKDTLENLAFQGDGYSYH